MKKSAQVADTMKLAGQANERASVNEKEAAQLRKSAEDERLARVELEEALASRRLSREQENILGSRLSRSSGQVVTIWCNAGDIEADTFALEIASALFRAKWKVFTPASLQTFREPGISFLGSASALQTGVSVCGPPSGAGRDAADALIVELRNLGFDVAREPDSCKGKSSSSLVLVTVNVRPEGPQGAAKLRAEAKHGQK